MREQEKLESDGAVGSCPMGLSHMPGCGGLQGSCRDGESEEPLPCQGWVMQCHPLLRHGASGKQRRGDL